MPTYDLDNWRGMSPMGARVLFAGLNCPWWVAGGWAIDLHLGRQTREHHDIDIGAFACDQMHLQDYLARCGWELHCADPPGNLRPWRPEEELPGAVHDIWCRRSEESPWELQLMLNHGHDGHWVSRRDPALRLPYSRAVPRSRDGIPYLAPELQLHFKARSPRPRDEADFEAVVAHLSEASRTWLREHLVSTYGQHPWLARL